MNEQFNNEDQNINAPLEEGGPQAPLGGAPAAADLNDDIDLTNKSQRMVAILVVIILVAAGIAGFIFYSQKQSKIDALDKLKSDFATEHNAGYDEFWKTAKLDLNVMKTNVDFEAKITEYLSVSSIAYTKHVKEKAIPMLEKALLRYRALEAAGIMLPELKATYRAMENLLAAWNKFVNDVSYYETYLENRGKLTEISEQWAGAQSQPKEDKFKPGAAKYVKVVNCILSQKGKSIIEYEPVDLSLRIKDTCALADEQSAWFKKVAFECLDYAGTAVEPDPVYEETVKKYSEETGLNQDTKSVFAINNCLDLSRKAFETELSNSIVKVWADYGKAKNELLKAIDARKKEL
ncbi:MAG: hypothetical protein JXX29_04045 [Deltaproteobacteria bacterium]|nr:hypothetical protein [Deltaproteobacteria bacterium]MBN2670815.1 hypothetical protein [Deltaproteobacteria bacterium]